MCSICPGPYNNGGGSNDCSECAARAAKRYLMGANTILNGETACMHFSECLPNACFKSSSGVVSL